MYEVIFYETVKGNSEVHDFILDLDAKAIKGNKFATVNLGDIQYTIDRAEDGMPHSRPLRKKVFELRPGAYRITYFIWQGKMVLLTVFRKTTGQTPDHEIDRAIVRMDDWIYRYGK